ncbi:MAG: hypothetical protein LBR00_05775 [Clostridiales Family XIII bacterium]|jgi:hypothetical protein|nr:hypothetical protein [Clostridiales Family XIII bacterium]
MDFEELLQLLEIDAPSEFVYFEQFAELVEHEEDISADAIAQLAADTDSDSLSELVDAYFEDMLNFVPDEETEVYTLIQTIGTTLAGLAGSGGDGDDESAHLFAEELVKFRNWYLFEGRVRCTDRAEGEETEMSVYEALTNVRLQNLDGGDFTYDFTDALDYTLDEYVMSLTSLLEDDYGNGDDEDEEDYHDPDDE